MLYCCDVRVYVQGDTRLVDHIAITDKKASVDSLWARVNQSCSQVHRIYNIGMYMCADEIITKFQLLLCSCGAVQTEVLIIHHILMRAPPSLANGRLLVS